MDMVMVRYLVVIICAFALIDMKFSGCIGVVCNAQEMNDNAVQQMWIQFREELDGTWLVMFRTVSSLSNIPRRSLRDMKLHHHVSHPASVPSHPPTRSHDMIWQWVLAPSSSPSPSPSSSPSPSASPSPSPSASPSLSPSASAYLKQKSRLKDLLPLPIVRPPPIRPQVFPPPPPPQKLLPPPPPSIPPPAPISPPPRPQINGPKFDHEDKNNNNVSAFASIALAAVTLSALFLACYVKKSNKSRDTDVQRGDRHVVNLSSSDTPAGPDHMPQNNGNVSNVKTSNGSVVTTIPHKPSESSSENASENKTRAPESSRKPEPPLSPPPPPPPKPAAPGPPPPPRVGGPPIPHSRRRSSGGVGGETAGQSGASKAKLKPFFWDKVNASPSRSMVWHELKCGSFQVNEEKMESLFGYNQTDQNQNERKKDLSPFDSTPQFVQIIDARKAQNLSILLKALNVTTEEVCDALTEGNELPLEFVQTLLKIAPTEDEELKLRLFTGDISELGPADRFLKLLIAIPFAFKRLESLQLMSIFHEETSSIKQSFAALEVASNELRNSRLFLKLLEAVLKTGNRMNDGTYRGGAEAFKLDTLLKLSDVKGTDGKTTLLHFVVQEICRSEGLRAIRKSRGTPKESSEHYLSLGLQVVSGLSNELENVKKAAVIDRDILMQSVAKLNHSLSKAKEFLETEFKSLEEDREFCETLSRFVEYAEGEVSRLVEEEKKIFGLVKSTGDYFHGKTGNDEGLRLFVIVRDFLLMLDKVCRELGELMKPVYSPVKKESPTSSLQESSPTNQLMPNIHQQLFPSMRARQEDDDFSSDDDSSSP